jgi:hypothetical protein
MSLRSERDKEGKRIGRYQNAKKLNPESRTVTAKSSPTPALKLIKLRLLVGFLGEKRQATWWDCGFLDATGRRFLETTFPRTSFFAALHSTAEAARLLHDKDRAGRSISSLPLAG